MASPKYLSAVFRPCRSKNTDPGKKETRLAPGGTATTTGPRSTKFSLLPLFQTMNIDGCSRSKKAKILPDGAAFRKSCAAAIFF